MDKIYLSKKDKKIAGVIGGIGERYKIDSTILRLIVVFVAIITGIFPAIVTYLIACLIIPANSN